MTKERHANLGVPEFKLHDEEHDLGRRQVVRSARFIVLAVVLLLLAGLAWRLLLRWSENKALDARAAENAVLHVRVIQPGANRADGRLTLPGTLQSVLEAQIYARANGYVKEWLKDIGAPVKKGEVLATLDLPEVSRQVDEAAANFQLTKSAYERWRQLRADDAVSQQELDEKTSAYRQAEAVLKRLRDQLGFGQVVAPFDGIVTRRSINVGDLVNA
ncbi:MAG: efflux RND transporter periplasmic adaptor subunit, partial [Betaproteobacteria bacterium]|nr:efflux RND transporter periplasmic adaptor subunit [Betaproteobacteria bacterium]